MTPELKDIYYNTFIIVQSFELLWTYNYISEGELFEEQAKEEASKLVTQLANVYKIDKGIYNSKTISMNSDDSDKDIKEFIKGLKKWAKDDMHFPIFYESQGGMLSSNFSVQNVVMCLKAYLSRKLNLLTQPTIIWSSGQVAFKRNQVRWSGHLPWQAIDLINDTFVDELSNTDTLVIVADIRKSQDLMTYGPNPDFFRDKILDFTTTTRKIIKDHYGIFDKFTGDGFLCYFNSSLCDKFGLNYYEQMLKASKAILQYSETFFGEWIKHIRKLPPNSSGLTLGIDSGIVKFRDLDNHLFAIGDAIVWANRMSSAGIKGEVIVNNLPFYKIKELKPKLEFETIQNVTKGGDAFTAYKLKLE